METSQVFQDIKDDLKKIEELVNGLSEHGRKVSNLMPFDGSEYDKTLDSLYRQLEWYQERYRTIGLNVEKDHMFEYMETLEQLKEEKEKQNVR